MRDTSSTLSGQLAPWPSQEELARILKAAGLRLNVGLHAIRVEDCSHFVFRDSGQIDADASTQDEMIKDGKLVSIALAHAEIKHRFEVYGADDELVEYFHFAWPQSSS